MKMVKSLLLGTAAGLVAMTGAQAADLPVKAKPVQYVKICSLYGAGFYYIPGTDMCLKIGGWVRAEYVTGYNGSITVGPLVNNLRNRSTSDMTWRRRGYITADARNQTEYGTVRSYIAVGTLDNDVTDNAALLNVNRAFIQVAGFTFGQTQSFFDFYSNAASQYGTVGSTGSDSGDGGWKVASYTAQFGNGLSATIGAEMARRTNVFNASTAAAIAGPATAPSATVANSYQGFDYPDVVANLRVDQAWGSAQIMGAWHGVAAQYYGTTEGTGHPGTATGWALGAGIKLNAPMIGAGDFFQTQFTYANGASRYTAHTAAGASNSVYNGNGFGYGFETDGVYGGTVAGGTASNLELTTSWAVNASFEHFWNKSWQTSVWGAYRKVDYNNNANAMLCTNMGLGAGGVGTAAVATAGCNNDWSMWGVGSRTQWNLDSNTSVGLEVFYASLKSASTPTGLVTLAANSTKPAGVYTVGDQNVWTTRLRVHRNFYP